MTDIDTGARLVASASVLGRLGCFVKTPNPFPAGTKVTMIINHDGREFVASAAVVHLDGAGMGISFGTIAAADQAILEEWLAHESADA